MLSILQAIWQADGAFPSGSFAFSWGVEGAIALRPELDQATLTELTATIIRQRWLTSDRVALIQAFRAAGDLDVIAKIDRNVEASTFGSIMRDGSRRNGGSFLASHARLGDAMALRLRGAVRSGICLGHIAVMQGAVWQAMGLSELLAQLASAYGAASGVTSAAVRLGAIGALDGQKILRGCLPLIDSLVADPVPDDAQLSSFIPFLEIAAARHARADLRLFAN
jgi:urease accessory protein